MAKNKRKNKNPSFEFVPAVGLQTSHFKARSRDVFRRNASAAPRPDIQVVHQQFHPGGGDGRPISERLGQRSVPAPFVLPPGIHCKTSNFTSKNFSTCHPCGPQISGNCPICNEFYFDLTPHYWSYHELELSIAQKLAMTGTI